MKKTFLFLSAITFLFLSCKKNDPQPVTNTYIPVYSASATLDDTAHWNTGDLLNHSHSGNIHTFPSIDSLQTDYLAFFDNNFIVPGDASSGRMMIGLSGFRYKLSEYVATILPFHQSMEDVLTTTYYADSSGIAGPEVVWVDYNFEKWSSRYGDQSGSTFTITDNMQGENSNYETVRRLRGTFSCKVYRMSDPTQFRTVTNGNFHIYLPKYAL